MGNPLRLIDPNGMVTVDPYDPEADEDDCFARMGGFGGGNSPDDDWYNFGTKNNPKIEWREGSGQQTAYDGSTINSLGETLIVGLSYGLDEKPGDAKFYLFDKANIYNWTAMISGNTIPTPTDPKQFGTLAAGLYEGVVTMFTGGSGHRDKAIQLPGDLPALGDNPGNDRNIGRPIGKHIIDGVFIHWGARNASMLGTLDAPISRGCQTLSGGAKYKEFMSHFTLGQKVNYLLIRK